MNQAIVYNYRVRNKEGKYYRYFPYSPAEWVSVDFATTHNNIETAARIAKNHDAEVEKCVILSLDYFNKLLQNP